MFKPDGSQRPSNHQCFYYSNSWHCTTRLSTAFRTVRAQARPPQIATARVGFVDVDGFSEPRGRRCVESEG